MQILVLVFEVRWWPLLIRQGVVVTALGCPAKNACESDPGWAVIQMSKWPFVGCRYAGECGSTRNAVVRVKMNEKRESGDRKSRE